MGNAERNDQVKEQITAALLTLMKKQDYAAISISEICDAAGVSRSSVYRNYEDKDAILRDHLIQLSDADDARRARSRRENDFADDPGAEALFNIFDHVAHHRALYRLLAKQNLLYLLKEILAENVAPGEATSDERAYALAFLVSGIFGWVEEWIRRGMHESPEDMATQLAGVVRAAL